MCCDIASRTSGAWADLYAQLWVCYGARACFRLHEQALPARIPSSHTIPAYKPARHIWFFTFCGLADPDHACESEVTHNMADCYMHCLWLWLQH